MNISGESFNLSVNACWTLYFPGFLVSISCVFSFRGNICFIFGCLALLFAIVKNSFSLRASKVSRSRMFNAFSYFSPNITFSALFWTRSRSLLFSWVMEESYTVADCSKILLTNNMYIFFSSWISLQKLATLLNSSILAFAFFVNSPVFRSQQRLSWITVPSKRVLLITCIGLSFSVSLVVNC